MRRSYLLWCPVAALVLFGPVAWRVLSWERARPQAVDAASAKAGEALFKRVWQPNDPLCPNGDGLGPVFNARSCVACHHQSGPGGGGALEHNVTTFLVAAADGTGQPRSGVLHAQATSERHRETLTHLDPSLPPLSGQSLTQILMSPRSVGLRNFTGVRLSQRNTPALFGAKWIDEIPDRVIIAQERRQRLAHGLPPADTETVPVGRTHRLPDGRVARFGWKAQSASLSEFVQAACANEMGLGNPGNAQPASLARPGYKAGGLDLTQAQCDQMTAFIAALPRPAERPPADPKARAEAAAGKTLFTRIGCAACHTPNLGHVEGLYSDLLLHRMGVPLESREGSYGSLIQVTPATIADPSGPLPDEWRTPPLWGVADSAPYLHDGRAATLEEAIALHGGQGAAAAQRFERLSEQERAQLIAFLRTLRGALIREAVVSIPAPDTGDPSALPCPDGESTPYGVSPEPPAGGAEAVNREIELRRIGRALARAEREVVERRRAERGWRLEKRWYECLLYPLRVSPLLLALAAGWATLTAFFVAVLPDRWDPFEVVTRLPLLLLGFLLLGQSCASLHATLALATAGKSGRAAWPGCDLARTVRGGAHAVAGALAGPVLPAMVAFCFWLDSGDLQAIDWLILAELIAAAVIWWALALFAVWERGRFRDANPVAVIRLVERVGRRVPLAALLIAAAALGHGLLALGALEELHRGLSGWLLLAGCWAGQLFWTVFLLRWLGVNRFRAEKARRQREPAASDG